MSYQPQTEAATSRFLNVEEGGETLRIHFNDCGQGDETVVMLHGSGPGATGWANFSRNIDPLVEAGYPPEMAYFECFHEMKLIVDLMYEGGMSNMRYSISNTAEYGDYYAGPQVITDETKAAMKTVLARIQDGSFAHEFMEDSKNGQKWLKEQRMEHGNAQIEEVGANIRSMFSFVRR